MNKKYVIYLATNKITGKMYVGKTYDFEKRKREHMHDVNDGLPFHRAIKKYGIDNIDWKIIDYATSDKEAREKEAYWIKRLNTCVSFNNSNGYNITCGGDGGISWNSKAIVQFTLEGVYVNEYISCAHADSECRIYSGATERAARCKGVSNGYQWRFKDEWDGGPIEPYVKPISVRCRKVIQMDLDGYVLNIYSSIQEASNSTGVERSSISSCLSKKNSRAGGFQWIYEEQYNPRDDYKYKGIKKGNGIVQLDDDFNIINHFRNCSEAARALGLPDKTHKLIHRRLKENKRCYGFYWRKYDDIVNIVRDSIKQ